jgi:RND superfamily putative drug exporter
MDEHQAWPPAREYGYLQSDALTVGSPAFRSAIAAVRRCLAVVAGNQISLRVSRDRHAALVVGSVSDYGALDQTRQAILDLQPSHPRITIAETGDISASQARDHVVNDDLHRAELLSIPVTFIVLLFAFGALVAALVPVVLALTAVAAAFGCSGQ